MDIFARLFLVVIGVTVVTLLFGEIAGFAASVVLVACVYDRD